MIKTIEALCRIIEELIALVQEETLQKEMQEAYKREIGEE